MRKKVPHRPPNPPEPSNRLPATETAGTSPADARLRLALRAADLGIWDWDLTTNRAVWSDVHERIFGFAPGAFSGDAATFFRMVHPDDLPRLEAAVARARDTGVEYQCEFRIIRRDGAERWCAGRGTFLYEDGRAVRATGIIQDITDARNAALHLQASEERYRTVVETMAEGLTVQDASGAIVAWNQSASRILGLSGDQLVGRTSLDPRWQALREDGSPFPGTDHPAMLTLRTGAPPRDVLMGVHNPDGEVRWISINAEPIFNAGSDTPDAVICTFTDITERRRSEEALRQSEEHFRALFSQAVIGIAETDLAGRFVLVNQQYCDMLGYTQDELLALRIHDVTQPDDLPHILQLFNEAMRAGKAAPIETRHVRKDGTLVWARSTASLVRGPDGRTASMVAISQDITEARRLEEQVRHAQKLEGLGVLAGSIAHDFNNLLVGMLGNASVALHDLPADSPAAAAVRDIEATARQAAELTRQLLDYSGRGRFVVQPVDLSDLVAEMRPLLATLTAKTATLQFDLAPGLPYIEADAPQVRQVVVNLVTNASDALEGAQGLITVRTVTVDADRRMLESGYLRTNLPEGRYVALVVSDSGVGMAPETLARLFDPFFTTKATGHGLGLSATLGIIRGHRGSVKVESTPGRGTSFTILFPVAAEQPEAPPVAAVPRAEATGTLRGAGTVLVVDDEAGVRDVARRMLTRAGFGVREAADGREALALFDRHSDEIVLVLLDLSMPVLGGEACLRELRTRRPDLPVILTSGYNEADVPLHVTGQPAAPFVQKPFVMADLIGTVRRALKM